MEFVINKNKDVVIVAAGCITKLTTKHITRTLNNYELFLVTQGNLYLQQEGHKYCLKEGDFFISDANKSYGGFRKSSASFFFLHLDMQGYISHDKKDGDLYIPQHFHLKNYTEIAIVLNQIINFHRKENCEGVKKALLNSLFEMISYSLNNEKQIVVKNNRRFNKMLEDLIFTSNMVDFISVKQVADAFSYNPRYLSYLFKRYLGTSVNKFLIDAKIDKSKRMLLDTKKEIKEIANNLGYRSDYFVKFFKKYTGITPTQYRNGLTAKTQEFVAATDEMFRGEHKIG